MKQIDHLISLADKALAIREVESFLKEVAVYLDEFETWQKGFEVEEGWTAEERKAITQSLENLQSRHTAVVNRATNEKDSVGSQMVDIHKRATVMKKYVDRFPSRITITGRRKG